MIRVLVVDDHPVLRAGLETVLRAEPGFVCLGAVTTRDAARLAARVAPDVVLGTRAPIATVDGAATVVDDARDLHALFDRLRLAARDAA